MRTLFLLLAIVFIVAGIFMPLAWVIAAICFVIALGFSHKSVEYRADGKPKSTAPLGFLLDALVINSTMHECEHCKSMIPNEAKKCKYCGEWVGQTPAEAARIEKIEKRKEAEDAIWRIQHAGFDVVEEDDGIYIKAIDGSTRTRCESDKDVEAFLEANGLL